MIKVTFGVMALLIGVALCTGEVATAGSAVRCAATTASSCGYAEVTTSCSGVHLRCGQIRRSHRRAVRAHRQAVRQANRCGYAPASYGGEVTVEVKACLGCDR